jgi:hypothetical protein
MTIDHVELSWSKAGSGVSTSDGRTFTFTNRQGYQVTHSADATDNEILNATGIPSLGAFFPGTIVPCKSKNREVVSPIFSMVLCDFSIELSGSDGGENPDPAQDPVNAPPVIEWSDETSNEPIDQTADDTPKPIQTVNGEKINGVTIDIADPVLVVQKNFANYNPHLIHQYRMAVNSDTFYSFAPGTARLISAPGKLVGSGGNLYWQVTARFKFRYPYNTTAEKAWYARVLHEGFRVKETGSGDLIHATDEAGNKVVTPVPINSLGFQIAAADAEDDSEWLEFKRYKSLPFNALGFS